MPRGAIRSISERISRRIRPRILRHRHHPAEASSSAYFARISRSMRWRSSRRMRCRPSATNRDGKLRLTMRTSPIRRGRSVYQYSMHTEHGGYPIGQACNHEGGLGPLVVGRADCTMIRALRHKYERMDSGNKPRLLQMAKPKRHVLIQPTLGDCFNDFRQLRGQTRIRHVLVVNGSQRPCTPAT